MNDWTWQDTGGWTWEDTGGWTWEDLSLIPVVSVRKAIIAAIIVQLKTISIINGYNTDLDNCVRDWNLSNIPIADLPCIEVNDSIADSEIRGQYRYKVLDVELVGRIATTSISDARNLIADIKVAMAEGPGYPDSVYLSLLAEKPELLPEKRDKQVLRITLSYEIKHRIRI